MTVSATPVQGAFSRFFSPCIVMALIAGVYMAAAEILVSFGLALSAFAPPFLFVSTFAFSFSGYPL